MKNKRSKLVMLPYLQYPDTAEGDPLLFYYLPIIRYLYRRRVELCLSECNRGSKVLEVGFGSGVTFLNLNDMYSEIHGLDLEASTQEVSEVFHKLNVKTHLKKGNILDIPYKDDLFDTVLLISILEHLKPEEQITAFKEINRVLKPGGQAVYGVPIERPFMVFMFRLLGCNIREHHFSTERDVYNAASKVMDLVKLVKMKGVPSFSGDVYEVGHFVKRASEEPQSN